MGEEPIPVPELTPDEAIRAYQALATALLESEGGTGPVEAVLDAFEGLAADLALEARRSTRIRFRSYELTLIASVPNDTLDSIVDLAAAFAAAWHSELGYDHDLLQVVGLRVLEPFEVQARLGAAAPTPLRAEQTPTKEADNGPE